MATQTLSNHFLQQSMKVLPVQQELEEEEYSYEEVSWESCSEEEYISEEESYYSEHTIDRLSTIWEEDSDCDMSDSSSLHSLRLLLSPTARSNDDSDRPPCLPMRFNRSNASIDLDCLSDDDDESPSLQDEEDEQNRHNPLNDSFTKPLTVDPLGKQQEGSTSAGTASTAEDDETGCSYRSDLYDIDEDEDILVIRGAIAKTLPSMGDDDSFVSEDNDPEDNLDEDSSIEESPLAGSSSSRKLPWERLEGFYNSLRECEEFSSHSLSMAKEADNFEQCKQILGEKITRFLDTWDTLDEELVPQNQRSAKASTCQHCSRDFKASALRRRLKAERFGGMRRRRFYERSRRTLQRRLGRAQSRRHLHPADSSNSAKDIREKLAHFGGGTRREMFRSSKEQFEAKFEKEVKPLAAQKRRRRSLSPVRRNKSKDQAEFVSRMYKSDSNLMSSFNPNDEASDEEEEEGSAWDPKTESMHKSRQERLGGLRRRSSFKRSKRMLSKKLESVMVKSKEDKERFCLFQRMDSYRQSKQLFEGAAEGSSKQKPAPADDSSMRLSQRRKRCSDARKELEAAFKEYQKSVTANVRPSSKVRPLSDLLKSLEEVRRATRGGARAAK